MHINKKGFTFGQNWEDFLSHSYNAKRLEIAKQSISDFLDPVSIKNKTFLDIGCGSGLFSEAAHLLKAKSITSLDIDRDSVACVQKIHTKYPRSKWEIFHLSILSPNILKKIKKHDIVYSWGVLHHTGKMWKAIDNACRLVNKGGYMVISIYNDSHSLTQGNSKMWIKVKRFYHFGDLFTRRLVEILFIIPQLVLVVFVKHTNPVTYIRDYKNQRGMSWYYDVRDWLGGYPYEYARVEEIVNFVSQRGLYAQKINQREGIGCNEFLFKKCDDKKV